MLFGGCQNKNGIMRWFFQRFQESIKSRLRKHVHFVDDVYLVSAGLWRYSYLLYQAADVINRVIGCCIKLVDIKRITVLERNARVAYAAGFAIWLQIFAINGFGQD